MVRSVTQANVRNLWKTHDVNPFRSMLVPLMQLPIFLSMFYGLRRLAELPFPQFLEGGFAWVTDLTMADPYCILPLTSILFTSCAVGADLMGLACATWKNVETEGARIRASGQGLYSLG
jgi:YidC/Oxa1 family membrane protein insertase